jgi:hypothetical protein
MMGVFEKARNGVDVLAPKRMKNRLNETRWQDASL